jgi:SOS response regulatory protein OraA/RecX
VIPSDAGTHSPDDESGQHIAPVTYLFGAPADVQVHATEPASEGPALSPNHPVFRDEAAVTAVPEPGDRSSRGSFDRVSNVSMYALARRGMSSREMRDYLIGREFEAEVVDEEIVRLEGVGLLDDDSLAETLVRTLRDRKGLGRSALTAELRRRNLDGEAIEEAMGGLEDDELERATAIASKRAPQLRALDSVTAKRRLGAFLMRKGYSGSVISTAVQRALEPSGPTFR